MQGITLTMKMMNFLFFFIIIKINFCLLSTSLLILAEDEKLSPEAFLNKANNELQVKLNSMIEAQWNLESNITKENERILVSGEYD